ncbi:hypothetical protein PIB30_034672 [Stylosanthes scabra]|uniref:Uncharacterized protein n=1 Tax=Stylosanthes scabra TaxID=79078 RepID=A0ABU6RDG6_9FABA|nr:hypothetical protein [Stylosanthes scabra]
MDRRRGGGTTEDRADLEDDDGPKEQLCEKGRRERQRKVEVVTDNAAKGGCNGDCGDSGRCRGRKGEI